MVFAETFSNESFNPIAVHRSRNFFFVSTKPNRGQDKAFGILRTQKQGLVPNRVAWKSFRNRLRCLRRNFFAKWADPGILSILYLSLLATTLAKRFRPLVRRRFKTFCPAVVFIRARKPCFRLALSLLGWKVRFMCLSFVLNPCLEFMKVF